MMSSGRFCLHSLTRSKPPLRIIRVRASEKLIDEPSSRPTMVRLSSASLCKRIHAARRRSPMCAIDRGSRMFVQSLTQEPQRRVFGRRNAIAILKSEVRLQVVRGRRWSIYTWSRVDNKQKKSSLPRDTPLFAQLRYRKTESDTACRSMTANLLPWSPQC